MRAWISSGLVTLVCLTAAPAALADVATSSNWAGYAAHRAGVSFRKVTASWRQPTVTCRPGTPSYSAYWVGIGGFSPSSPALEQIGTEADCTTYGRALLSAWYELVPAPSIPFAFPVSPGEEMSATVLVQGHRVTLSLYNATRHRGFTKTLFARTVDTSSAEWVVEAPSECSGGYSCRTLPLADFGAATFTDARAQSTSGRRGAVASAAWSTTKINLLPGGRRFVAYPDSARAGGAAAPSTLQAGGSSFRVTYSATATAAPTMSIRAAGALVHPTASR